MDVEDDRLVKSLTEVCTDILGLRGVQKLKVHGNSSDHPKYVTIELESNFLSEAWKQLTRDLLPKEVDIRNGKITLTINALWTAGLRKAQMSD